MNLPDNKIRGWSISSYGNTNCRKVPLLKFLCVRISDQSFRNRMDAFWKDKQHWSSPILHLYSLILLFLLSSLLSIFHGLFSYLFIIRISMQSKNNICIFFIFPGFLNHLILVVYYLLIQHFYLIVEVKNSYFIISCNFL